MGIGGSHLLLAKGDPGDGAKPATFWAAKPRPKTA